MLTPGSEPRLLTTVERKASLIAGAGVDVLVVLPFDRDFSLITAESFVADVLVGGVHAQHAAMGANFSFGFKALGTMRNLPELGAPFGLTAEAVPLVEVDGEDGVVDVHPRCPGGGRPRVAATSRSAGGSCSTARS